MMAGSNLATKLHVLGSTCLLAKLLLNSSCKARKEDAIKLQLLFAAFSNKNENLFGTGHVHESNGDRIESCEQAIAPGLMKIDHLRGKLIQFFSLRPLLLRVFAIVLVIQGENRHICIISYT